MVKRLRRTQAEGPNSRSLSLFLYSPLDGMLVHRRVTPQQYVVSSHLYTRAQLFEGRLALIQGLNLTRLSFNLFKSIFSDNFLCYSSEYAIVNLLTERIKLNLLFELSNLNSNFTLTLGYLNPALNNPALGEGRQSVG